MALSEARSRVARGAALLDARSPGWAARVDPDALDLPDPRRCVLGQTFGGFGRGVVALELYTRLADHGFAVDRDAWWDELTAAWRDEAARRAPGGRHGDPAGGAGRSDVGGA